MGLATDELMTVEAELHAPAATARLVRFQFDEPVDKLTGDTSAYRLDLCLTPRPGNARACYPERWSRRRFERIGPLFLLPAGEAMRARSDGCCRQASIICELQSEVMRDGFDGRWEWTDRSLLAGLDIRDASIHSLLMRLAQEARHPGFVSDMLVELITAQLAIELRRYCAGAGEEGAAGGLQPWRLRLIDERIRDEVSPPTLAELAALCRLSVRQLTRGFRASRGRSVGDYLADIRVERARRMLAGQQSVKSIAYSLGFSSPSSFCFAFRRAVGETPGEYRSRLQRL